MLFILKEHAPSRGCNQGLGCTSKQANETHTLAHVTNHSVCQMEENKNLEENSLFSIYKDINKTEAQHCGYSSQEELCSPAKRAEQQTPVSPSRDVI